MSEPFMEIENGNKTKLTVFEDQLPEQRARARKAALAVPPPPTAAERRAASERVKEINEQGAVISSFKDVSY